MDNIFKTKAFWVSGLIATAVIFVAISNINRNYSAETDILVIPKSQTAALSADQIVNNLGSFTESQNFFKKMYSGDPGIVPQKIIELPDYKQKEYWRMKVRTVRIDGSGIIRIIATDPVKKQAENLSDKTTQALIGMAGLYYDIKNDVDLRILEGTITRENHAVSVPIIIFESLAGGFALTFLVFFISFSALRQKGGSVPAKMFEKYGNIWDDVKKSAVFDRSTGSKERKKEGINKEKRPFGQAAKNEPAADASSEAGNAPGAIQEDVPYVFTNKKSAAPDNLPIAPDNLPITEGSYLGHTIPESKDNIKSEDTIGDREKPNAEAIKVDEVPPTTREATPEEVKERLNKLLSGKLD